MTIYAVLSLLFAATDWYAVFRRHQRIEIIAKPATLIFLIFAAATLLPRPLPTLGLLFLLGLVFSLLGDIFLVLPRERFVAGLVSFLLAHVAYIVAFNLDGPVVEPATVGLGAIALLLAASVFWRLRQGIVQRGEGALVIPVAVYCAVLTAMLWSALAAAFRETWPPGAGALVAAGGVLFFLSDAVLAWNRFVRPLRAGRLITMVTYHLAQYALTAGVVWALNAA